MGGGPAVENGRRHTTEKDTNMVNRTKTAAKRVRRGWHGNNGTVRAGQVRLKAAVLQQLGARRRDAFDYAGPENIYHA